VTGSVAGHSASATTAVIGLGAMGSRIARRFLDSGRDVAVFNRDRAKADGLGRRGAVVATTPADAVRRADAVIVMVSDAAALRAVAAGPDGFLAGLADGACVVQMSTVEPAAMTALAAVLPAGTTLLDAPVMGSVDQVEAGSLHIFVGGAAADVERLRGLLSAVGSVSHVGGIGAGSAAKLVANAALFGVLGVLGEVLLLADRLGLDQDTAFRVLAATPLAAQAERRRPAVQDGAYPARFALGLARKDADLIQAAASGVDLRLVEAARSWLADAERAGLQGRDYTAVLGHILRTDERRATT
jgi:3-hydroxyisobutyrate dehydrogenase/2-hydroxy-3-oxopropionate reductase